MSETDDESSERERIREQKREELRQEIEDDGGTDAFDSPVHVDGPDHLERLVADNDVVLVDFYADWCGPCKMLEPVVEEIAATTDAVVAKVDVDRHQGLANESNVRGVPTLVLYSDGHRAERLVGVQEESRLKNLVGEALA